MDCDFLRKCISTKQRHWLSADSDTAYFLVLDFTLLLRCFALQIWDFFSLSLSIMNLSQVKFFILQYFAG